MTSKLQVQRVSVQGHWEVCCPRGAAVTPSQDHLPSIREAPGHTLSDSLLHLVPGLSVPTRGTWGLGRQERCRDSLGIFLDRPHMASRGHPSSSPESLETTHPMAAGRGVWELPRDPSELQHLLGSFQEPPFQFFGEDLSWEFL